VFSDGGWHALRSADRRRCLQPVRLVLPHRLPSERGVRPYVDPGADAYDVQDRTRVVGRLRQRAENLGFGLVNLSTDEVVEGSVS